MAKSVTVEEMLSTLPRSERVMVDRLRSLVFECLPKASEKGYYGLGIPFYRHHRLICFIWPSSVVWGPVSKKPKRKKGVVSLGFCQGNRMANDEGWLLAEGRKRIYVMHFSKLLEIDDNIVKGLLFEAGMIDDAFAQLKRKSNSTRTRRQD